MSTTSGRTSQAAKTTAAAAAVPASARLEKSHPGVRRSTPDSEALASSDDDGDHQQQLAQAPTTAPASKPTRRTSWLNEVPLALPRKASLTIGGPLTSGGSNPASPAADPSSWAANTSPGVGSAAWNQSAGSSFPWGTGIWNTESRKEPPQRLSELVPSPTTASAQVNTSFAEEILSPTARTLAGESAIPFSIPLHPTPKTYRSQSYSVGQLDPEVLTLMASKAGAAAALPASRSRAPNQYSALQHRASRPSLLGELGHDTAMLGRVREDEDDDESGDGTDPHDMLHYSAHQARTIEQLSRENAALRQAAGQLDSRLRDRAMSSASAASGFATGAAHNLHRIKGSVPEESDLAVEDLDELGDIPGYGQIRGNMRRRFSEYSANPDQQYPGSSSLENRALENVKKAHWQTSLGFGSVVDIPQSRRHSFADIPLRHASISSASELPVPRNPRSSLADREDGYGETALPQAAQNHLYYAAREPALRAAEVAPGLSSSLQTAYSLQNAYSRQQSGLVHPHQNQLLYLVTFKCHRADVFYIQEDTGLQVKPGDLVIVEADRGTDLGTVQHANVSFQKAKELKQQYAEEHYKWLMMFSRQGQSGAPCVVNSSGAVSGLGRSAIGGMGPHGPHGLQDPPTELKPKLIKRLAQNHEILTLRDKEGNEAKAKRVCQQKVVEHRLNMEILDAEFQMDWKKLTFYYFADSYINFNSLVTDLFKIYKTRIWMSAINPASFVTPPTAGLQSPSAGMANNPLMYGPPEAQHVDRRHHDTRPYGGAGVGVGDGGSLEPARDTMVNPLGLLRTAYGTGYQGFGPGPGVRQPDLAASGGGGFGSGSGSGLQTPTDPFGAYPSPTAYSNALEAGYAAFAANGPTSSPDPRSHPAQNEWVNRFQGLSLGS